MIGRLEDVVFGVIVAVVYWISIVPMLIWPNYMSSLLLDPDFPKDRKYAVAPTLVDRACSAMLLFPAGVVTMLIALSALVEPQADVRVHHALLRELTFARLARAVDE